MRWEHGCVCVWVPKCSVWLLRLTVNFAQDDNKTREMTVYPWPPTVPGQGVFLVRGGRATSCTEQIRVLLEGQGLGQGHSHSLTSPQQPQQTWN